MQVVIEVEKLTYRYPSGRLALKDVSFRVHAGERVGLAGANGAGKSTLISCLLGVVRFEGKVRVFGVAPGARIFGRIGVVFQNPEDSLFMPRLLDDLTLPLRNRGLVDDEAERRARAVLRQMGLEGYATEPATHLSLGLRKRAALAASLVLEPELLILDEPTAELDARARRELIEVVRALRGTLLVSSHDLEFLRHVVDRLLVLEQGRLVADGPVEEILQSSELLERCGLV